MSSATEEITEDNAHSGRDKRIDVGDYKALDFLYYSLVAAKAVVKEVADQKGGVDFD